MVEPVGATLGVLGLAGLFSVVIEVWDFVDAGRGYSEDFSYLKTRLDNQREIFVQWGRRMNFGSSQRYNPRLDDPRIRPRIEATLNHMQLLFSNTNEMVKKYGIRIEATQTDSVVQDTEHIQIWQASFERFRRTIQQTQRNASITKITRWSIRDGERFKTLVDRVSELNSDISDLTMDFVPRQRCEEIAREEAETIQDLQQLQKVQDVISPRPGYAESMFSNAVSVRQRQLERADVPHVDTGDETLSLLGLSIAPPSENPSTQPSVFESTLFRHGSRTSPTYDLIQPSRPFRGSSDLTELINVNAAALRDVVNGVDAGDQPQFPLDARRRIFKEIIRVEKVGARSSDKESTSQCFSTWAPISPRNMYELLGSIRGPVGTPYEGGVFHVRINIPSDYPFKPPICWFLTKVYHPNIDEKGAICLDILEDQWSAHLQITQTLVSILSLLSDPNPDDHVFAEAAALYKSDRRAYDEKVKQWTGRYATGEIIYPGTRSDGLFNTTG